MSYVLYYFNKWSFVSLQFCAFIYKVYAKKNKPYVVLYRLHNGLNNMFSSLFIEQLIVPPNKNIRPKENFFKKKKRSKWMNTFKSGVFVVVGTMEGEKYENVLLFTTCSIFFIFLWVL